MFLLPSQLRQDCVHGPPTVSSPWLRHNNPCKFWSYRIGIVGVGITSVAITETLAALWGSNLGHQSIVRLLSHDPRSGGFSRAYGTKLAETEESAAARFEAGRESKSWRFARKRPRLQPQKAKQRPSITCLHASPFRPEVGRNLPTP